MADRDGLIDPLIGAAQNLQKSQRMRLLAGEDGAVYVIRETHLIEYLHEGMWYPTVEGVDFEYIKPWKPAIPTTLTESAKKG